MSDENDIGFKIFALIDGLKESMGQAASSVKVFAEEANANVERVGSAFENLNKIMLGFAAVIAGGVFFKEAIDSTVKWTDEIRGLSKQFGITTQEASGLAVALDGIGSSTEEYRGAAAKLDRQVKSNEETVNKLGVATRDANGNFLSQQAIVMGAIETLKEYKEGTDRNIAGQFLFGRGAGDLAKLLRLNSEELERGTEEAKKFGLEVDAQASGAILKYKRAINDVHDSFEGIQRVIGTALIPMLTSLAEGFTSNSVALRTIAIMVKTVETAFVGLQTLALGITDAIGGYFAAMVVKFQTYTEQIAAYATLNFTKANEAAKNGQAMLDATMKEARTKMANDMAEQAAVVGKIWNIGGVNDAAKDAPKEAAGPEGKTLPKGFGDKNAEKEANKERVEMAQLEVTTKMQLDKIALQNKKDLLQEEVDAGRMTKAQQIEELKIFLDQENEIERAALERQRETKGLSVVEKKKIDDQLLVLQAKHEQDIHRLTVQRIQQERAEFKQYFDVFNNGFKSMIQGVLQGTQTWRQAMQNMFSNILVSFAGFLEEKAAKWVQSQLFELAFGKATSVAVAQTGVSASAAQAGAAAYASISAIPVVGPFLAPAAAALAFGSALAFGASISSAKNGFDIPSGVNPVTQLHEEEMVLPAGLANAVRGMADGGGSGGNFAIHIHAIDSKSGMQFIKSQGAAIAKEFANQMRNANPHLSKIGG